MQMARMEVVEVSYCYYSRDSREIVQKFPCIEAAKLTDRNRTFWDVLHAAPRGRLMIIIIIIAFKGAIRDFLQSPHSAANCLQHVRSSGLGATVCKSHATHRALITCKCDVTCHLVRRDSSAIKFDRAEIAFI